MMTVHAVHEEAPAKAAHTAETSLEKMAPKRKAQIIRQTREDLRRAMVKARTVAQVKRKKNKNRKHYRPSKG